MLALFVDALTLALPAALTWTALWLGAERGRSRPAFGIASLAGAAVGVLVAVSRQAAGVNREVILIGLLPVSLLLAGVALASLWRGGARPGSRRGDAAAAGSIGLGRGDSWGGGSRARPRWGSCALAGLAGVLLALQLPELLLLTRGFAEPGTSLFTSEVVLKLTGCLAGIGLALLIGWAVAGAARGVGPGPIRLAVTGVLAVTVLSQLSVLGRILLARRLIGLPRWGFQTLVWASDHEAVFTVALVVCCLLPAVAAVALLRRPLPAPANPAQGRLQRAAALTRRRFLVAAATSLGAAAVALTWGRSLADAEPELSPPEPFGSDASAVWVELAAIDDGHLHRHSYPAHDRTEVRFITLRKGARAFVACLDACEICGPSGYYERDGKVICKLCDVAMNTATIGFKGGCNPIPIDFTVADGRLVIAREVLEASVPVFA